MPSVHCLPVSLSLYKLLDTLLYQRIESVAFPMKRWTCPIRILGLPGKLASTTPTISSGWKGYYSGCLARPLRGSSSNCCSAYSGQADGKLAFVIGRVPVVGSLRLFPGMSEGFSDRHLQSICAVSIDVKFKNLVNKMMASNTEVNLAWLQNATFTKISA